MAELSVDKSIGNLAGGAGASPITCDQRQPYDMTGGTNFHETCNELPILGCFAGVLHRVLAGVGFFAPVPFELLLKIGCGFLDLRQSAGGRLELLATRRACRNAGNQADLLYDPNRTLWHELSLSQGHALKLS